MELAFLPSPNPLLSPSPSPPLPFLLPPHRPRRRRPFLARASSGPGPPPGGLPWQRLSRSIRRGSHRFWLDFGAAVKKETGFDVDDANAKLRELAASVMERAKLNEAAAARLRSELLPAFLDWNRWERWKVMLELCMGMAFPGSPISYRNVALVSKVFWCSRTSSGYGYFASQSFISFCSHVLMFCHVQASLESCICT